MPASKSLGSVNITDDERNDSTSYFYADAGSSHPGALCARVHIRGANGATLFSGEAYLETATPVLDGEGKPTGAYTYAPISPLTQAQVDGLKTRLTGTRRFVLAKNGFTVT